MAGSTRMNKKLLDGKKKDPKDNLVGKRKNFSTVRWHVTDLLKLWLLLVLLLPFKGQ